MSISRRDFMKFVGVSLSSLVLSSCNLPTPTPTCYAPMMPTPTDEPTDARGRLRKYWLSFGELASKTQEAASQGGSEDAFGQELSANHRKALDELVAGGSLPAAVAELVQEAYDAAIYHVWRSNAPITCYEPALVNFAPESAQVLVDQSSALDQLAAQGNIDPQTIENARKALEHDLAFYSLSDEEVNALYKRIADEWQAQSQTQPFPSFAQVDLEIPADAQAAAQFIIDLLLGR